jgi:RNA polymerase sigma factor (sigma-70 family)
VHSQFPAFLQGFARFADENERHAPSDRRRTVVGVREVARMSSQEEVSLSDWVPPSWEEIVREHSARVYRLAYRLTGNPHDAEDLTQDVFVRVFRSLDRFQPGTFEGWLHRITTNLFLDGARRRQKIRFDGLADGSAERLASAWPTPISTMTSPRPWRRCRRSSGQRSCSATSRASATRKSRPCWTSRSAPYAAESTGAAPNCARRWLIDGPPGSASATSASRTMPGRIWSLRGQGESLRLRRPC